MSGLYLDASVLLPKFVREPGSDVVDEHLSAATDILLVSEFAAAEVASAISRLVRTGIFTDDVGREALNDFDLWRAAGSRAEEVESVDARLASLIVRRFELMLRAPDAMHIAICRRLGATLVTMDRRLAIAAQTLQIDVLLLKA